MLLERIEAGFLGFFGEAAAEVVDGNDAEFVAEAGNKFSPREAPGGVSVDHQERGAWVCWCFVEEVQGSIAGAEPVRFEGVFEFEAGAIWRVQGICRLSGGGHVGSSVGSRRGVVSGVRGGVQI